MEVKYKAAQLGYGQLGAPWFKYISSQKDWRVDLLKSFEEISFNQYDYVFLAVNDTSLSKLIDKLQSSKVSIIHFSGSRYNENALGLHPVYSFSKEKKDINFKQLNWVVDHPLIPQEIINFIGPSFYYISPDKKKLYHNYLSVSANMTQLLSHLMGNEFNKKMGLPGELMKNLVIQSLENEMKYGRNSFSGPWVRDEKKAQDKVIDELNDNFLSKNNSNFNELIEVYNEYYRL